MKNREVELGSHSWMDGLAAELFPSSCLLFRTLSLRLCSVQPLKQQLAKYTGFFALAGSLPLQHCCSGG